MSVKVIPDRFVPEGHADEGDVVFLLNKKHLLPGSEYRSLKVCSRTMSRASRAFRAMFNPRFTGKADFSSADPLELPLPDDDSEAIVWMCFALHLQYLPEGQLSLRLLRKLAVLCDKYDRADALQPWSRLWLREWMDSSRTVNTWEVLWMSYAFQGHRRFFEVSKELIYGRKVNYSCYEDDTSDGVGPSLLQPGLADSMQIERTAAAEYLPKMLEQAKRSYTARLKHCCDKSVQGHNRTKLIQHLDKEFKRLELNTCLSGVEKEGVRHYLRKLTHFKDNRVNDCTASSFKCGTIDEYYTCQATDTILGLCLRCVRQSRLCSSPKSFCASGKLLNIEELEACVRNRRFSFLFSAEDEGGAESGSGEDEEGVETEAKDEDHKDYNCMAATRWEHEERNA